MKARLGLIVGVVAVGGGVAACGSGGQSGDVPTPTAASLLTQANATHDTYLENGRFKVDVAALAFPGEVTAFSTFSDGTGGVGLLCVGLHANGSCNNVPVSLSHRRITPGATAFGTAKITFHVDVSDNNQPLHEWTGELRLTLSSDGIGQESIVQLADFNGIETVGAYASANGSPDVTVVPSTTFVCITDSDCTLYGLDTTNGPYSCANNTCVQARK